MWGFILLVTMIILPLTIFFGTPLYALFKRRWKCLLIIVAGVLPVFFTGSIIYIHKHYMQFLNPQEKQAVLNLLDHRCETKEVECKLNRKVDGWDMVIDTNYLDGLIDEDYKNKMSSLDAFFNITVNHIVFNNMTIDYKDKK